ncbi:hypothetical protein M0802_008157 [Mischocyttarus mexicanus]|nr:hypothetical protein M0802_008157 [Mischocyttarus mexicanus]
MHTHLVGWLVEFVAGGERVSPYKTESLLPLESTTTASGKRLGLVACQRPRVNLIKIVYHQKYKYNEKESIILRKRPRDTITYVPKNVQIEVEGLLSGFTDMTQVANEVHPRTDEESSYQCYGTHGVTYTCDDDDDDDDDDNDDDVPVKLRTLVLVVVVMLVVVVVVMFGGGGGGDGGGGGSGAGKSFVATVAGAQ